MKVLELFAGSRSIGKVCDELGHNCFSVDNKPFDGINLVKDIEHLTEQDIQFVPDMVWVGTPCTTYSLAGISHHRHEDTTPKTDFAFKCDSMNIHVLKLIRFWLDINPDMIWYIENPRAVLRKMWFMQGLNRTTVTYCSYGDTRMKPTDIWSNNIWDMFNLDGWKPRPMCFNGNDKCQHEPAPRGSKTGTQGLKDNYERSKMPYELCKEIVESTANKLCK